MIDDPLTKLLHETDQLAGTPAMDADDLLERVIRGVRQRRRHRRISAAVAAIAIIGIVATLFVRSGSNPRENHLLANSNRNDHTPDVDVDRLRDEYEHLRIAGDSKVALLQRVSELRGQQSRLAAYARAPRVDLDRIARNEAEVAARLIVYRADRIYREPPRRAAAIQAYRRAITLFPYTAWADIARERLIRAESLSGEST